MGGSIWGRSAPPPDLNNSLRSPSTPKNPGFTLPAPGDHLSHFIPLDWVKKTWFHSPKRYKNEVRDTPESQETPHMEDDQSSHPMPATNFIAYESVRSPGPPCCPTLSFVVCFVPKIKCLCLCPLPHDKTGTTALCLPDPGLSHSEDTVNA